ncbi:unnamed protein product [Protopolystoma xenopodis]|uniref:Uncharacterized protein n=1 Tax=Protopolystoma xenopodis TaxID=117903 RepID=A0A448XAN2_9PLAT|nr:unnamed protein product [Protopolystoma xenopodis]
MCLAENLFSSVWLIRPLVVSFEADWNLSRYRDDSAILNWPTESNKPFRSCKELECFVEVFRTLLVV